MKHKHFFSWGHIRRWVKTQKMGSWRLISQHMVISCGLTHPHMILGLDTCGYQSLAVGMVDFLHRGAPKTSRPIASTAWIISLCNINIRRIDDSMTVFPGIYLPSATQMIPEVWRDLSTSELLPTTSTTSSSTEIPVQAGHFHTKANSSLK
jgi:hypothetical protein